MKLYRCSNMWVKLQGHPCWRVQSARDEQGNGSVYREESKDMASRIRAGKLDERRGGAAATGQQ